MTERVAIVTGAARGIGRAIALRFLRADWRVCILDIDPGTLAAGRDAIAAEGNWNERILSVVCDVSDPKQVGEAVSAAEGRFGRLDAVVNNAGIAVFKPLLETTY